jgi:hypothetical protein
MGWLFAVSLALQEQRERALWRALPPVALGHLLALVAVALPLLLVGSALRPYPLAIAAAATLLVFGVWKLARWYRHPRWVGMRVGGRDLILWSFLMATGHGAGLMVAPTLVAIMGGGNEGEMGPRAAEALIGIGAHTAALFVVMAAVAWVVYRWIGLAILRSHWINFDLAWAVALLVTGAIALTRALRLSP